MYFQLYELTLLWFWRLQWKKDIQFHASTVVNKAIKTCNSSARLLVQTNHVQTTKTRTTNQSHGIKSLKKDTTPNTFHTELKPEVSDTCVSKSFNRITFSTISKLPLFSFNQNSMLTNNRKGRFRGALLQTLRSALSELQPSSSAGSDQSRQMRDCVGSPCLTREDQTRGGG